MTNSCVNLIRSKKVLLQEGLQQDAPHLAGAQNGYTDFGKLRRYFSGLNGYLRHGFPCLDCEGWYFLPRILAFARRLLKMRRTSAIAVQLRARSLHGDAATH